MPGFTSRLLQRAFGQLWRAGSLGGRNGRLASPRLHAVPAGALLGGLVWALAAASQRDGEAGFRLAMALTMVVAGSLAFVLYALHGPTARAAVPAAARRAEARVCLVLLGGSLTAALELLQVLLG